MVKFTYDGKDYTLGFNRKTAETAQRSGLNLEEIDTKPLVQIPLLFRLSFLMNHPRVKNEKIDEIFSKIGDKTELYKELIKDYRMTFETLFDEDGEDGEDNENLIKWSAE